MIINIRLSFAILIFVLISVPVTSAQEILYASPKSTHKKGEKINPGTPIVTQKDEWVVLNWVDPETLHQALIKLEPLTEITLVKSKENEPFSADLKKGGAYARISRSIKNKKPKSEKPVFKLKANGITMGVRGTEFYSAYSSLPGHKNNFWMCVQEGSVHIQSPKDPKEVEVKEGLGVISHFDQPTARPKKFEWTQKLNWNLDPTQGDVESKGQTPLQTFLEKAQPKDYE